MDARVPVRFGLSDEAGPEDVVLLEGEWGQHMAGCACCAGGRSGARSGAGRALGALFERRARGELAFFRAVLVVAGEEGRREVAHALREDVLASARFRLEAASPSPNPLPEGEGF